MDNNAIGKPQARELGRCVASMIADEMKRKRVAFDVKREQLAQEAFGMTYAACMRRIHLRRRLYAVTNKQPKETEGAI